MEVRLHRNATTTPRTRELIRASTRPVRELAREHGVSETAVRRWKGRADTADRPHTPRRLATRFTAEEEEVVRELRVRLGLSLDDMLEVVRRCVRADISRSALHRCLRRLGLSRAAPPVEPGHRPFDAAPFGYVHADLKHLARLEGKPAYVFVAIERTTRFVHVAILPERGAAAVAACWERFLQAFGHPVHTVLTDNGSEFTDRFAVDMKGKPPGKPSGRHPFDRICAARGVRHKLTRPYRPQTNGMAERFNRRIGEAVGSRPAAGNAGRNRFHSHAERDAFILAFVQSYNRTRLRCLDFRAPLEALTNLPGHNTQAGARHRMDRHSRGPV